jgi:4-carboxymuconolactone decarboxylase
MTPEELAAGRAIRREVLGEAYVQHSKGGGDPLVQPKVALSEYVWSKVWARPGIDRRTRSFMNLVMLTALNRPHEVRLHVAGALNNGLTPDEIAEALLHAAAYCGIAAARDSMDQARAVFRERGIT